MNIHRDIITFQDHNRKWKAKWKLKNKKPAYSLISWVTIKIFFKIYFCRWWFNNYCSLYSIVRPLVVNSWSPLQYDGRIFIVRTIDFELLLKMWGKLEKKEPRKLFVKMAQVQKGNKKKTLVLKPSSRVAFKSPFKTALNVRKKFKTGQCL